MESELQSEHIFMIELCMDDGRWVPIKPCYNLEDAEKKLKREKYRKARVARYLPDPYWDAKAYVNEVE